VSAGRPRKVLKDLGNAVWQIIAHDSTIRAPGGPSCSLDDRQITVLVVQGIVFDLLRSDPRWLNVQFTSTVAGLIMRPAKPVQLRGLLSVRSWRSFARPVRAWHDERVSHRAFRFTSPRVTGGPFALS
jgi:hypothetical protein